MKSAFLMHPLNASYVRRSWHRGAKIWGSLLSDRMIERIIKPINPYVHSTFKVNHHINQHESMIVICPITSRQILELPKEFVVDKLRIACDLAHENGAGVISLGAYSAIGSSQGLDLVGKTKIGLTTGRAYTVYAVMEQAKPYVNKDSAIAIVGADGAIGSACAQFAKDYDIIKITKKNLDKVYDADVVITATSDTNSVIDPNRLKKNSVVIDAAKPSDISRRVDRKDITIIDGGLVKVPCNAKANVDFGINFDCPKNTAYACIAEPMILAMSEMYGNYCIGNKISIDMANEIGRLGEKCGFEVVR